MPDSTITPDRIKRGIDLLVTPYRDSVKMFSTVYSIFLSFATLRVIDDPARVETLRAETVKQLKLLRDKAQEIKMGEYGLTLLKEYAQITGDPYPQQVRLLNKEKEAFLELIENVIDELENLYAPTNEPKEKLPLGRFYWCGNPYKPTPLERWISVCVIALELGLLAYDLPLEVLKGMLNEKISQSINSF